MSLVLAGALALALSVSCAIFAPFARNPSSWHLRLDHPDAPALGVVNWRRPLWQWEGLRAACVATCGVLSSATPLPVVPVIVLAALCPSVLLRSRSAAARWQARRATTHLLRVTEAALRSGGSLPESLRRATEGAEDRLARRPFIEALRAFDLGAPLDQALRKSAREAGDSRTRMALETLAMGIASRLPYDRAGVLVGAVADRLSFEERLDEEVRARTGGLRAQVILLALLVPAIAAYLALTVPSLAATLGQPIARFVLIPAALTLEIVGVIASRHAIDGTRR
jgi:Flp pilus assembly protein TadB